MSLPNGMRWESSKGDSTGRWITTTNEGRVYSYDTIPAPRPRFLIIEFTPVIGEGRAYFHISVAGQRQAEAIITAIETARQDGSEGRMTTCCQDHPGKRSGEIPVLHLDKFEKKIKRLRRALREFDQRLASLEMLHETDDSDKAQEAEKVLAEGYVFVPEAAHVCSPPVTFGWLSLGDDDTQVLRGIPVLADGRRALEGTIWRCSCGVEWTVNDLEGWERLTPVYK